MITSRNVTFFVISRMVPGFLVELQTFWLWHLIELLKFLIGLQLIELEHLINSRLLMEFSTCFLQKLKLHGIYSRFFGLILSIFSNRRLRLFLNGKSWQEYPANSSVPYGSIHDDTRFLQHINDLPDDAMCDITIYVYDTTLYYLLFWSVATASNIVDYCRNWLVDFNTGKTQIALFDR